ncbi:MAG: L,D-transpeptidase family protein [Clostridia bacterium]|nr:L,D-transpeptidase family protein [Clostridia bacterium]
MEEENKIEKKPKTKRKLTNRQKKKIIIIAVAIIMVLIIAIIIGIISRVTSQTSANVGKQNNGETSQTNENENNPEEQETPNEQQNNTTPQEEEKPQEPQVPVKEPEEPDPKDKTNKEAYYIKVNNQANVVTIYKKDANGEYTVPYKAMVCSVGTATPTDGVYKTTDKYTWRKLFGHTEGTYVYGQYATRIVKSILFHSVPYANPNDPSSLEYWEYDKLGTKASAGCVRLTVEDAKWIYDNCAKGTQVEFYSSADPGPLGKPTARKISNEATYVRGWDPTDPSGSNPWKTYTGNTENQQKTDNDIHSNDNVLQSPSDNVIQTPSNNSTENVQPIVQTPNLIVTPVPEGQQVAPSGGDEQQENPKTEDNSITSPDEENNQQ